MTQPTLFGPPAIPDTLSGDLLRVASMLYDARPRKLTAGEICDRLGWTRTKSREIKVRHIAADLDAQYGLWVCGTKSGGGGYWIAESIEEWTAWQERRIGEAFREFCARYRRLGSARVRRALGQEEMEFLREVCA